LRLAHLASFFAAWMVGTAAVGADPGAVVTLLEGEATIIRGTARYALAEGVRLAAGDIIEVGDKGLAVIEFPDATALSLGPRARLLAMTLPRGKPGGDFYVVQGALKHAQPKAATTTYRYVSALATFTPVQGTITALFLPSEAAMFLESGEALVIEPAPRGVTAPSVRLRTNDFYSRKVDQKGLLAQRPPAAFIAALPRLFLDPLPSRMARYKDRELNPRPLGEVSYAEVETWLKGPPEIRRSFFTRFLPRVQDPAFRAALVANVRYHMEWDRTLFPEKYKPKPDPAEAAAAAAAARDRALFPEKYQPKQDNGARSTGAAKTPRAQ
jgi:hypothetical protein